MEIFEKSRGNSAFRNMVADPALTEWALGRNKQKNFCGCGMMASGPDGEELLPEEEPLAEESVRSKVMNVQTWSYVKTGLAVVGAYVLLKLAYNKFMK